MSEALHTLGLDPLCRFAAEVEPPCFEGHTPLGHRIISPIRKIEFGDGRLVASQRGPAVESLIVGSDGTAFIEIHFVVKTKDNAFILVNCDGRANWGEGPEARVCRITVTFETEFSDLQWLNSALAVGVGTHTESRFDYQIYELT
jgi:hypothetical protein